MAYTICDVMCRVVGTTVYPRLVCSSSTCRAAVAASEPNVTLVEGRVVDVIMADDTNKVVGVKWVNSAGKTVETRAPLSVLADGYYSVLRKVRVRACTRRWAVLCIRGVTIGSLRRVCTMPCPSDSWIDQLLVRSFAVICPPLPARPICTSSCPQSSTPPRRTSLV